MEHQVRLNTFDDETDWHKYNLAKTSEKRLFYKLLSELCQIIPEPVHEAGRRPIPVRDMFFMTALKIYSNYSCRKIHHDLKEAELAGYIERTPHFNRISEFLNCPSTYDLLSKMLTISAIPLKELEDNFSIDSSGFGSYQYERWQRARWKNKRGWRNYVKGHICIGTRTNIICSATITYGNLSDVNEAPKLIQSIGKNFAPRTVSADKGYSAYRIYQIINSFGAIPFIAFKENANPGKYAPEVWKKMFEYFKTNKERFFQFYHKRSNVETTFSMVKLRLGEFLKSKNYEAQRSELLMKFICHNICCLVSEIFENEVHIDFRECIRTYIKPDIKERVTRSDFNDLKMKHFRDN